MLTAVSGRYANTVSYTYDAAGRKATESLATGGKTYVTTTAYNPLGQVSSLTYPNAQIVSRTYTPRGQLHQIKLGSTTIDTRTYDDSGRLVSDAYNNSVTETRTYNADNTLAAISFNKPIGNLAYTWDANKNKTGESVTGVMNPYGFTVPASGYDAEDRLTAWNRTTGLSQSWNLSLVGDWNTFTSNTTTQTRTHGPTCSSKRPDPFDFSVVHSSKRPDPFDRSRMRNPKFPKWHCSQIEARIKAQSLCIAANLMIQLECYGGRIDQRHADKLDELNNGLERCVDLRKLNCAPGDPMRDY